MLSFEARLNIRAMIKETELPYLVDINYSLHVSEHLISIVACMSLSVGRNFFVLSCSSHPLQNPIKNVIKSPT